MRQPANGRRWRRKVAIDLAVQIVVCAVVIGSAHARVVAMIAKQKGRVVVSVHDGDRLRWWNTTALGAVPAAFQPLKQEHRSCDVTLYEQRLRWTADGRAELLCSHRAWWFDGAKLSWWDVPHHQGNFDTGIAPLPDHRVAYCESPTPHGGTDPYCAQFADAGTYYRQICRDRECRVREYGGTFGFHHYLRRYRLLFSVDRLELDDERTGKRLFYVGDRTLHDYNAMVSPDEALVMTVDAADWNIPRPPAKATLWSLRDGRRVRRIPGDVAWGAFSPDTRYLAVFAKAEVRTYALRPFRLVATVRRAVPVTAVAWSDDGRALFIGDEKDGVERIDPRNGARR